MPKARRFASIQEEIIFKLSESTFGEATLFQPHLYGMGKEPADIAWVTNRCAVLMYMQESKGSFLKKRNHNIKQLIKWLRKWKSGETLRGTVKTGQGKPNSNVKTRDVSFQFEDVDHVIGLSIVDGGEVFCQYHERVCADHVDLKLTACGTLSGSIMRLLTDTLANPRTLLYWLRELRDHAGAFTVRPDNLATEIRNKFEADLLVQQAKFFQFPAPTGATDFDRDANVILAALKFMKNVEGTADLTSDLSFADFAWLSLAHAHVGALLAGFQPSQPRPSRAEISTAADMYLHRCAAYVRSDYMVGDIDSFIERRGKRPGIDITASFDFGPNAPLRMLAVSPRLGPSVLQNELDAMRLGALAPNATRR